MRSGSIVAEPSRRVSNRLGIRSKKKKARRILRPDEKQKSKESIPVSLTTFERFYAGLLRSEAGDYLGESRGLWKTICSRLALPAPIGPLPPSYSNKQDHFSNRAALVVEEARQALADNIRLLEEDLKSYGNESNFHYKQRRHSIKRHSFSSMEASITRVEHKESGHSILTFSKKSVPFTKDEVHNLRLGTVFSCLDKNTSHTIENILLGIVLPQNREEMINSNSFAVMLFRKIKKTKKGNWKLTPIVSLLSEQRKFEACIIQMATPVPFLLPLLGRIRPAHVRAVGDNTDNQQELDVEAETFSESNAGCRSNREVLEIVDLESIFRIPRLNDMQEKAAAAFLQSESNTISLVQGPPGTGKTTLLTSVICRYVIDSRKLECNKRCLMVCAPTNKAINVLCSRFLDTFFDDGSCPCNAVLLGDEDKLLENETWTRGNFTSEESKLRESFLYTFVDTVIDQYLYVRKILDKKEFRSFERIQNIVCRLKNLLIEKVHDNDVIANTVSIFELIKNFSKSCHKRYPTEIVNKIDLTIGMIRAWNRDDIWREVLQAADVVFCTLGSSGSSLLKKIIGGIDDLVVDEAASATEPEIYIPFQYRPRRLLCVGDPMQLPATVTSRFAEKMGLSKSLHERLMYDCNYHHIMLDTQYRMKPELSQFPSNTFYGGRLVNGKTVLNSEITGRANVISGSAYTLYQIDGKELQNRSGSIENEAEANAVVEIVDSLRNASRSLSSNWSSRDRLRIITFYQAQVSLIKRLLHRRHLGNIHVGTVDSSQGCEADLVIISFVRSSREAGRGTVGFLADDRRLNVALTRAKYQMICVGNIERMTTLPDGRAQAVKRLAIDAFNRRCVHPFPFQDRSLCRTIHDDSYKNKLNKKRKPEQLQRKRCHEGSVNKGARAVNPAKEDSSNASSDGGSDVASSIISSSSSYSDSSTTISTRSENGKPNMLVDTQISTTERINFSRCQATSSSNSLVTKYEDSTTVMDENCLTNKKQKTYVKSNLSPLLPTSKNYFSDGTRPAVSGTHRSNTAAPRHLREFASDVGLKSKQGHQGNHVKSNVAIAAILGKSETIAVFENFSF